MSVQASEKAIQKVNKALTQKGWNNQTKLLEIAKSRQQKLHSQQLSKFFNCQPVARSTAEKIAVLLDVSWEDGDLELVKRKEQQNSYTDIDELFQKVRARCCEKIQHLYSKIQLLNLQQIDVDKLYVDVYVLEEVRSESYATIPDLLQNSDLKNDFERLGLGLRIEETRAPGFKIANESSRLMVLGKPGSGKSTFVRHLAIDCCKGKFQPNYIPILIELRSINASNFSLLKHIHQQFELTDEEQTKQILKQGKVLILLDGLDEVPYSLRDNIQKYIERFSQEEYYKNRFIVTCRTQTTEYAFSTFKYIEIAEFTSEPVKIFAQNWFTTSAKSLEEAEKLTKKFIKKLYENKPTAELAVTPILLSLTCLVFNSLKNLPSKRSELYERGLDLLLEKWDKKKGVTRELGSVIYENLSITKKKNLLSYIAVCKFQQEQYVLFEENEIQAYIADELKISPEQSQAVLKAIESQHGLLIERAQGIWSFSHLTFQEYFVTKWFCDRSDWQGLVSHVFKIYWQEVFLMAIEMTNNATLLVKLIKYQIDNHIALALDKKLQSFLNWVNNKAKAKNFLYKSAAIRALYFIKEVDMFCNLAKDIDKNLDAEVAVAHALNLKFPSNFNLASKLKLDKQLILDIYLNTTVELSVIRQHTFNLALNLAYKVDSDLYLDLQKLEKELAHLSTDLKEDNKVRWTEKLRSIIIKHRDIGHNWMFSEQQK